MSCFKLSILVEVKKKEGGSKNWEEYSSKEELTNGGSRAS